MKTIKVIVKESKLIYPKKNNDETLNGVPYYETIVTLKTNDAPIELSLVDEFAYFDIGKKIEIKYNGTKAKIKEIQHDIPHRVNSLIGLGRKYPYIAAVIFITIISWIISLGLSGSILAALPVGVFWMSSGFLNIINFFIMKRGIIIKSTIKGVIRKYESGSTNMKKWKYYYLYEYNHKKQKLLHVSFFKGAKKNNIGTKVNLRFNEKNNTIIENSKRKNLLFNGLLSIIAGIIFCIVVFMVK